MKRIIHLFLLLLMYFLFCNLNCLDKEINGLNPEDPKIILTAEAIKDKLFFSSLKCSAKSKIIRIDFIEAPFNKRTVNLSFQSLKSKMDNVNSPRKPVIAEIEYEVEGTEKRYKRYIYLPFFSNEVEDFTELLDETVESEHIRLQEARERYEEMLKEKEKSEIEKRDSIDESNKKLKPIRNTRGENWEKGVDKLEAARLLEEIKNGQKKIKK